MNLCAPHLYGPFTPGVLSLFALLALIPWTHPSQAVQRGVRATAAMLPAVVLLAPTLQGPSAWDERVLVRGVQDLVSHLMLTGLYPLIPWCGLAWLGVMLRTHGDAMRRPSIAWCLCGVMICGLLLYRAGQTGVPWAAPTSPDGRALLTSSRPSALPPRGQHGRVDPLGHWGIAGSSAWPSCPWAPQPHRVRGTYTHAVASPSDRRSTERYPFRRPDHRADLDVVANRSTMAGIWAQMDL